MRRRLGKSRKKIRFLQLRQKGIEKYKYIYPLCIHAKRRNWLLPLQNKSQTHHSENEFRLLASLCRLRGRYQVNILGGGGLCCSLTSFPPKSNCSRLVMPNFVEVILQQSLHRKHLKNFLISCSFISNLPFTCFLFLYSLTPSLLNLHTYFLTTTY